MKEKKPKNSGNKSKANPHYLTVYFSDTELKPWAKEYAEEKFGTSLSSILVAFIKQWKKGDFKVKEVGTGFVIVPTNE